MAIVKVGTYRNPPEDITDYEAIVSHLNAYTRQLGSQAMILTEWTNTSGTPAIALGSYISHGGVLYVVESEEAVELPVADGTYYLKVAASGDTLALSWVSDISGYVWNAVYNGLLHADGSQILPYMLIKTGTSLEKWRITNLMQGGGFSRVRYDGAIKATSVDTGQGATEVHLMNQNLRTTDNVSFANINPPVDNSDISPPSIGKGGFTYAVGRGENGVTLPSGGTYVVVALFIGYGYGSIARLSGGTSKVFLEGPGDVGYLIMRIA